MLNLLIVDDEQIMRKAITSIVRRYVPEIEHIHDADSGRKAIEIARTEHIHIVCMDIKMPGIDGIEAISQMKKSIPGAAFIIISAFDEFKNAAAAIRLGVKQYLLKPLDREELVRVLYQAIEEQKQLQARNERELHLTESISLLRESLSRQILYALMTGSTEDLGSQSVRKLTEDFCNGGAAFVIFYHTVPEPVSERNVYMDRSENNIRDYAEKNGGIAGRIQENRLAVFVPGRGGDNGSIHGGDDDSLDEQGWIRKTSRDIAKRVSAPETAGVSIGAGCFVKELCRMHISYCCAAQAAEREGQTGIHIVYGDEDTQSPYHYPYHLESEIFQAVSAEEREKALAKFSELFSYIVAHANGGNEFIYKQLYIFSIGLARLRIEKNVEEIGNMGLEYMNDTLSMYKWCEQYIQKCIYDLTNRVAACSDNLIEEAIAYIHENYSQQITLADISGRVYLSSYYFTKLFKAKTGKTFVGYLTDYRIDVAKKLLKANLSYRIQDICEMVGYGDKKYFCKCFKKNTGMTPAAYRDSLQENMQ